MRVGLSRAYIGHRVTVIGTAGVGIGETLLLRIDSGTQMLFMAEIKFPDWVYDYPAEGATVEVSCKIVSIEGFRLNCAADSSGAIQTK
jgi:hypothetical protein